MKRAFDDDYREVTIDWSKPALLSSLPEETRNNELLYLVSASFGGRTHKLLYIGQAYSSLIPKRLRDRDHLLKQKEWQIAHPRHKLYVRYGQVISSWCETVRANDVLTNDLENILIYCLDNDHWKNKKGISSSKIKYFYEVTNTGHRSELPKRIGYGIFTSA